MHLQPLQYLLFAILHSPALQNTLNSVTKVIYNPNECSLPTQIVTKTEVTVATVDIKKVSVICKLKAYTWSITFLPTIIKHQS
jgi:hypothetical protein